MSLTELRRLAQLPVSKWSYACEAAVGAFLKRLARSHRTPLFAPAEMSEAAEAVVA